MADAQAADGRLKRRLEKELLLLQERIVQVQSALDFVNSNEDAAEILLDLIQNRGIGRK